MKAFKAPQRNVKIKNWLVLFSMSGIGTERVKVSQNIVKMLRVSVIKLEKKSSHISDFLFLFDLYYRFQANKKMAWHFPSSIDRFLDEKLIYKKCWLIASSQHKMRLRVMSFRKLFIKTSNSVFQKWNYCIFVHRERF